MTAPPGAGSPAKQQQPLGVSRESFEWALRRQDVEVVRNIGARLASSHNVLSKAHDDLLLTRQALREENARLHSSIRAVIRELRMEASDDALSPLMALGQALVDPFGFEQQPSPRGEDLTLLRSSRKAATFREECLPEIHDASRCRSMAEDLKQPGVPAATNLSEQLLGFLGTLMSDQRDNFLIDSCSMSEHACCAIESIDTEPVGIQEMSHRDLVECSVVHEGLASSFDEVMEAKRLHDSAKSPVPILPQSILQYESDPLMDGFPSMATVVVDARLRLECGTVAACRVVATDRCRDVAEDFITKHSIQRCFLEPLVAFLIRAEESATTFPCFVSADLAELRLRHCRGRL